jgi:hypothetical protein
MQTKAMKGATGPSAHSDAAGREVRDAAHIPRVVHEATRGDRQDTHDAVAR